MRNDERYVDGAGARPWGGEPSDVVLERMEESGGGETGMRRAWIQEDLMVYLFADGNVSRWEDVALRALAVMRAFTPRLLIGRRFHEVEGLRERCGLKAVFPMEDFDRLTACEEREGLLTGLLGYLFPNGRNWLKKGTMRVYVLARTFQPVLLRKHGRELSYERLEELFEGRKLKDETARNRARSRWSARVQKLIRQPVEANGGRIALQFGKSATVRAKYAAAARGNGNRKGKRKGD